MLRFRVIKNPIDFTPRRTHLTDSAFDCRAYLRDKKNNLIDEIELLPMNTSNKISFRLNNFIRKLFNKPIIVFNPVYKIPLGFSIQENSKGYATTIRGRSGLASKGILSHVGTIDYSYNDELCALLYNTTNKPFKIKFGDRICQLLIEKIEYPIIVSEEVYNIEDLNKNTRGGFGSSGVK